VRVVEILLERDDVDPHQTDTKYGQTPLLWAVEDRHGWVVKMDLEREGVNPDDADTEYGQTLLSPATL